MAELRRRPPPDPDDPLAENILLGKEVRERMITDDSYAKLGRYEVQLRRGLYQAVRELRMLRTQYVRDFGESPRRPAARDERAVVTGDAGIPNDLSFASDKDREKVAKVKQVVKAKKQPPPDGGDDGAPRKPHGPLRGRGGRIVPSHVEGATSEMCLPDGSVARIA